MFARMPSVASGRQNILKLVEKRGHSGERPPSGGAAQHHGGMSVRERTLWIVAYALDYSNNNALLLLLPIFCRAFWASATALRVELLLLLARTKVSFSLRLATTTRAGFCSMLWYLPCRHQRLKSPYIVKELYVIDMFYHACSLFE